MDDQSSLEGKSLVLHTHKSKISTDRNKCVLAFVIYSPKMLSADNRNGGGLCFKWKSGG